LKNQKIIIALDGYASTGKSTQAKNIAKKLDYIYIDSGAMYRAVTLYAIRKNILDESKIKILIKSLDDINIEFIRNNDVQKIYLNGKEVENDIRKSIVNSNVSRLAMIPEVRNFLLSKQRGYGKNKGLVMDGRDIGTVVFPNAECKFFFIATQEVRAKRRHLEQYKKGNLETYDQVLKNIVERDRIDSNRSLNPLKKSSDAIEIDVSDLTENEVFNKIWEHISKKIN
tara:strand:- start:299 stop:979 length:681 start_codon:yes stop_codon:yes gene_type:complete